jgi:hypothetical protein
MDTTVAASRLIYDVIAASAIDSQTGGPALHAEARPV